MYFLPDYWLFPTKKLTKIKEFLTSSLGCAKMSAFPNLAYRSIIVTNPRSPLRLNVGFLIKSPIGTSRKFDFEYEKMRLGEDLIVTGFIGEARFDRTPQGLLLQGDFEAAVDLQCVRCLDPFSQSLKWSFTDLFAFDTDNITDSALLVPEDGQIDMEPLMREYALLEFPISPVCTPDCKGLCTVCGENLNKVDCGHHPEPTSPFAALKDLLK
jgi:uncharacterized protein